MNIVVAGLWHLGCVTAACCARHFRVTGLDFDAGVVADLQRGKAPLFEPGLNELLASPNLTFTTAATVCATADILWIAYDTPVDDHDESDVAGVLNHVRRCLAHLPSGALVLISSQLPVGTCRYLEAEFPQFHFACSPENLRLGRALDAFQHADRVVIGLRTDAKKTLLQELFAPFTKQILWMRTESAEMVKHALNSFLALEITFINEIARVCEQTGADARDVAAGLKSDIRIGAKAYLNPGGPFAGGTLARDVVTLTRCNDSLAVIPAIKRSNDRHRRWAFETLQARLGNFDGKTVAVLGLTYTPNTDTLRRSAAVELCQQLLATGARVRAFDPSVKSLPSDLAPITLTSDLPAALVAVDAAVVCTEWPELRTAAWARCAPPVVVDANRFLEKQLQTVPRTAHLSVGHTQ